MDEEEIKGLDNGTAQGTLQRQHKSEAEKKRRKLEEDMQKEEAERNRKRKELLKKEKEIETVRKIFCVYMCTCVQSQVLFHCKWANSISFISRMLY